MRISDLNIVDYKRFTHLTVYGIPQSCKIVLLIGPNGSGKTSVFEAMNTWYNRLAYNTGHGDYSYFIKSFQPSPISNHVELIDRININFHDFIPPSIRDQNNYNELQARLRGKFYFRTAYRNDPDFTLDSIGKLRDPTESQQLSTLLQADQSVSGNYKRIVASMIAGIFENKDKSKTVDELRGELIDLINKSLRNVFNDLELTSLGDPLSNGSFYFKKGISENFHYKNLSAGEKSAFDILLDLIVKKSFYGGAIYCVDEPEVHIHTKLQSNLIAEMYNIIPQDGQLWLSTHSLGILKKAKDINDEFPGAVAFLDFDNQNFDEPAAISPSNIDKAIWQKFVDIALDDLSTTLAPKKIIFCEGDPRGTKNKNFDAQVYSKIFGSYFPDISFVSIGSSNDLLNSDNIGILAIKQVLKNADTHIVTDRDDKSEDEVRECMMNGIRVLTKRHLESYLLDDEIITKLCISRDKASKIEEALEIKRQAISSSISRGNSSDDIKSASGDIYSRLKRLLDLKSCGNNFESFLRDTMAPLVSTETNTFKALSSEVIGN